MRLRRFWDSGSSAMAHSILSSADFPQFGEVFALSLAMTFEPDNGAAAAARPSWWRRTVSWRPTFPRGSRTASAAAAPVSRRRRVFVWSARMLVAALILYYPLGAIIVENIDD